MSPLWHPWCWPSWGAVLQVGKAGGKGWFRSEPRFDVGFGANLGYRFFLFDEIHWFPECFCTLLRHRTCLIGRNVFQKFTYLIQRLKGQKPRCSYNFNLVCDIYCSSCTQSVGVRAKYRSVGSFLKLIFYIHNNSYLSSEHGLEPWAESCQVFTLTCGKTLPPLIQFIHLSAVEFADAWLLPVGKKLPLVSRQHRSGWASLPCLKRWKFSIAGRGFFLLLILLSGLLSCPRSLHLWNNTGIVHKYPEVIF